MKNNNIFSAAVLPGYEFDEPSSDTRPARQPARRSTGIIIIRSLPSPCPMLNIFKFRLKADLFSCYDQLHN